MVLPGTQDRLQVTIQVFQHLQQVLSVTATLSDVEMLLAGMEAEYGAEAQLEQVIQLLVGKHLAPQVQQRKALCQIFQAMPEESAA